MSSLLFQSSRRRSCAGILLLFLLGAAPLLLRAQGATSVAEFTEPPQPLKTVPTPSSEILSPSFMALPPEARGDLLMARGNYEAAVNTYLQAKLTNAVIWNKIGVAYHHLFAFDEALKAYQTALRFDPHFSSALNNIAAIYHGRHDYKQAEHYYKRALKYSPGMAVTYCNLGTSYFAEAKYKQGVKAYQTAYKIDPHVFTPDHSAMVEEGSPRRQLLVIHYYLAQTYANAGNKDQALAFLRKALDEGFKDRKRLMEDKGFASIRSTPEFQQLLQQEGLD